MNSLVSVVIPTHNRKECLQRAVESALSQTVKDLEIVVVDDCSPVPAAEILKDIVDPRLIVVRHEANKGVSEARNTGIQKARGEWIALLDDDDIWLPQKIEKQLALMQERGAEASTTDSYDLATKTALHYSDVVRRKGLARSIVHPEGSGFGSAFMARKSVFENVGPLDSSLKSAEDWDWLLRLYISGAKFAVVPEILMHYAGSHVIHMMDDTGFIRRVADKNREALRKTTKLSTALFLDLYIHQKSARAARRMGHWRAMVRHAGCAIGYYGWIFVLSPWVASVYMGEALQGRWDWIKRKWGKTK